MITTILRTARKRHIEAAVVHVADQLHAPIDEVTEHVAVAYICKHFEQGSYSGWDGFAEMLAADERSIARHREN